MDKEIAPRVVNLGEGKVLSRNLSGFDRALKYAADAINTTSQVELGIEAVEAGILQRPGIAAATATTTPNPTKVKRSDAKYKMRTTLTTMFVCGGLASASIERNAGDAAVIKRAPSSGLDGVNLNMAEGNE